MLSRVMHARRSQTGHVIGMRPQRLKHEAAIGESGAYCAAKITVTPPTMVTGSSGLRQVAYAVMALVIALLVFEYSDIDLAVQDRLYDFAGHSWIWARDQWWSRLLFYDGAKLSLIAFGLALVMVLLAGRRFRLVRQHVHGLRVIVLSLMLVPASVAVLKAHTDVPCPRHLQRYGGTVAYAGMLNDQPAALSASRRFRCFPAGHASGGFALFSLMFLFTGAAARRRAMGFALCVGWTMGGYKMLIGDHFLSHTVVTMLLAWALVNAIAMADIQLSNRWVCRSRRPRAG